jgi:penicillin amidase
VRHVRRLSIFGVVVVLVLVVAIVGLLTMITARALPQTSGTLRVAGLEHPVSVVRDRAGIAQITADSPHDLFLAQGYVHAQERLWQMEVWRHIGAGRLSELFGRSQLATDRFIRTLDWRGSAARDLESASPESRAAREAYAAGVNAYLDAHAGSLGLSFVVAGVLSGQGAGLASYQPERWTVLDSATWQKVQAFNLVGYYSAELYR